jgi:hypothetical protein
LWLRELLLNFDGALCKHEDIRGKFMDEAIFWDAQFMILWFQLIHHQYKIHHLKRLVQTPHSQK